MHKLQAIIIPDCLFKCIFSIILKLSLHFKIISIPIYSEPQVEAPDHNAFAANIVISSGPGWRKNLFFLRKNMKICANGAAWLEHCWINVTPGILVPCDPMNDHLLYLGHCDPYFMLQ